MIHDMLHIFFTTIFILTAIDISYLLIAAIAGHLKKGTDYSHHPDKKRIAVLIPSYKEDSVIIATAFKASQHNYPADKFNIYVAAHQLQPATLVALQALNIHITEVNFEIGSKAKSLNYLLNNINEQQYDIALILDGDNIMQDDFLEKINAAFHHSFRAAQGHRTAKNENTPVAVLDAISEEINNHLFRRAQRSMGLSSSTIGSGMAFEFKKLKEVYNKPGILDNPACDREVDFEMMKAGIVVEYIDNAYVLDEKVSRHEVYKNQRRRWLESQVIHLKLFLSKKERVTCKTKDYYNKLFINLIPPRIIFIALFAVIFILYCAQYFFHFNMLFLSAEAWVVVLIGYILSMLLSIPSRLYSLQSLRAMAHVPLLLFSLLKAVSSMKYRRKEFVHTPKSFTENISREDVK